MNDASAPGLIHDHLLGEMVDAMASLTIIMKAETETLAGPGYSYADQVELTSAKLRLTASIERALAQLNRERPAWMRTLEHHDRQQLMETIDALDNAATLNCDILERRLQLTGELMEAVAAEVGRLTGKSATTYSAAGAMVRRDQPTPIAVNSGL